MRPVEIKVRDAKARGTYEIVVNGQVLTERHHARYANSKAKDFAKYLKKQGLTVNLILSPKAI